MLHLCYRPAPVDPEQQGYASILADDVRVVYITPGVPSSRAATGGAAVMLGEIRAIAADHDVALICLAVRGRDDDAVDQLRDAGHPATVVWIDRGKAARTRRVARWLTGTLPLGALVVAPGLDGSVRSAVKDADLVHVASSKWSGARLLRAPLLTDRPTVLTEYEVAPIVSPSRRGAATKARWIERLDRDRWGAYLSSCYAMFDAIQVFTSADAASVRARAPSMGDRTFINPFGFEMPPSSPHIRTRNVLFVGDSNHPPNADAARWLTADLMPAIRRAVPDSRLDIVGRGTPPALAGDGVAIHGYVPDLSQLYATASVVVAPLRSGSGMRVKVLEAMAYGCPVVATPLAARGLVADAEDPPLIVASSPSEIVGAIVRLLRDPDEASHLGQRARRFVADRFSWNAYRHRLAATYGRAVDHHASRSIP
jgi:glycosyltransferase involved in cell wall biosynthesis